MRKLLSTAALAALASTAVAQSPLTTVFATNNSGAAGWTMYFDVTVNVPITIVQIDTNTGATGTAGSLDVFTCATTYVGNDTNAGAWTQVATGTCTGAAQNTPTTCSLGSGFPLAPGNYGIAVVHNGIYPAYTNGTGTSVPGSGTNQTYSTAELTVRCGASAGGGIGTAICCTPRVMNMNIFYSNGGSGVVATRTNYGNGCVSHFSSFYELFAAGSAFDLSNSAMSLVNNGSGYTALPGFTTYVAPTANATLIAVGDDVESTVTLASPLPFPGGASSTLNVCSNGFLSAGSNGTSFSPAVATMLAFANTSWGGWHDYYPTGATNGNVKFEEVGGIAYITWDAVVDFGGTAPNTWQIQFDESNGNVHFVWQTMSLAGGSHLVYFSPGGPNLDPGNRDISATLPGTFGTYATEVTPVSLAAGARPVINTTVQMTTSNIPAGSPFGAVLLGFVQFNPGLDLTPFGMAGCSRYTDGSSTNLFIAPGASNSWPLALPNIATLAGLHVYAQSAVYAPAAGLTTLGAVASNGVDLKLGNL